MVYVETQAAKKYIRSIRNESKRDYAERYYRWILDGGLDRDENGPEWNRNTLSYMAAQSVRMNLDLIYREVTQ